MKKLRSNISGQLPIKNLSTTATTAHVLPNLKSASLLSMGQLCDDDCIVTLDKSKMTVEKNNKIILEGTRNINDGLWDIQLDTNPLTANVIIQKNKLKQDLAAFYHGVCFSPTKKTFVQAINNGNFIGWPGLDKQLINKNLNETIPTLKGHMRQERKNLQSTQSKIDNDYNPPTDQPNLKTNNIICSLVNFDKKEIAYGDLTGKFPYTSSRGSQYFLVVYHYDANAILVHTLKSRQAGEITKAYMAIYQRLSISGNAPTTFVLDNESSNMLLDAFAKNNIKFQQVPPHQKRRNAAERAIQTWKTHFLSGLASLPPDFPIAEWDRLIFQGELTLNLLRNARANNKLSAWAYLFGNWDFNAKPLAPPGTKVIFHNKPEIRSTWDMRGQIGYYIAPAPHHYRCVTIYKPDTRKEIVTDTVKFVPHAIPIPKMTPDDYLMKACDDIEILLQQKENHPTLTITDNTQDAIKKIATSLRQRTKSQRK